MIAYEALNTSPKTPKANLKKEDSKKEGAFSFDSMLKSITKKDKTDAETTLVLLPKENDTKTQLLHLLKTPFKKEQTLKIEKSDSKTNTLLKLLKSTDPKESKELKTPITLNPEISEKLSLTELKHLIYKAKKYLKEKIEANPEFAKKYNPKDLPNNLKSLMTIAKELKIDIKEITYANLEEKSTDLKLNQHNNDFFDDISNKKLKLQKREITQQTSKQEIKTTTEELLDTKKTISTKLSTVKNTPILKEMQTTVTTQHIIQSKKLKNNTKQESTQSDLLEKLLKSNSKKDDHTLQENKIQQKDKIEDLFTTKQTTSIIEERKSTKKQTLEELLRNEINSQDSEIKPLQTHKSDSVEVKIQEAKQMMKFLSNDIKKAIDNYKPPFSRLKIQLNPKELGNIDLTVIQRGKNVHINLSSNNAALNILANNLNELKTQLNQNGINNASFNFNSQGEQKQDQGRQKAKQEYSYFTKDDEIDENLNELEIVIPRYI